jgi:hypothetical protein
MTWEIYDQNNDFAIYRSSTTGFGNAGDGAVIYEPIRDELWCSRGVTGSPIRRVNPETLEVIGDITGASFASFAAASMGSGFGWISRQLGTGHFARIDVSSLSQTANISGGSRYQPTIFGSNLYSERTPGSDTTIHRSNINTGADFSPAQNTGTLGRNLAGGDSAVMDIASLIIWTMPGGGGTGKFDGGFVLLNAAALTAQTKILTVNTGLTNDGDLNLVTVATKPGSGIAWTGNKDALYGWNISTDEVITHTDISSAGSGARMMVIYAPGSNSLLTMRRVSTTTVFQRRNAITGALISQLVSSQPDPQYNVNAKTWGIRGSSVYFLGQTSRLFRVDFPEDRCQPVNLDRLVYDIARRAGVPPHRVDVSGLSGDLFGYGIGRPASGRQQIELLQQYGFFDATDYKGSLQFKMRDRTPDGTIGGEDLAAHVFGEQRPSAAQRTRSEDYELPREFRVQYLQSEAEFEPGMQLYERRLTDAQGVADLDLTAIAMSADKAAAIAEVSMLEAIVARESVNFSLVATTQNKALIPSDIKTLDVDGELQTVRLAQLDYAWPGVQSWAAVRHDPSIYASDAVGISSRLPRNPIVVPGDTTLELLDAPLVRLADDNPGYFAAMGGTPTVPGLIEGWPGGDLFRQEAEGLEDIARLTRPGSYFGVSDNDPGEAPFTIRTAGPLIVSSSGPLVSITLDALLLGGNLAALEVRTGGNRAGWEIIQYQNAQRDENTGQWTLTNLLRGRFGTEWAIGLHAVGDRFLTLPNVAQILTDNDEINLSRAHRAATIGKDPDNSAAVNFAWTGVDRIPYAPVHLNAERENNDDLTLTWTRRDRVGRELVSGQSLPLSESSEAYEVDIYDTDGTTVLRTFSVSTPQATYTDAQQTADFGLLPTELDWDVRQMGALGRGYAGRIESEGL